MNIIDNEDVLCILYNLIKMMNDRGYLYLGTNYEIINKEKKILYIDPNYKISNYTYILERKNVILFKKENKYVMCLFSNPFSDSNMTVTYICKNIINYITNHKIWIYIQNCIIICPNDIEDKINKKLKEEIDIFETIPYSRLLYDLTEHIYAVKHEKIKNFEHKYKKYNLKLPILLKSDAMSKWYDYNINDIIKITRNDNSISHRIVKPDL